MNGAEIIAKSLSARGIKKVFTFPGGTIAPLFDALGKEGIEIICARHEQGAGYMALALARITRQAQVVMVTSGPGATNLATVIADAYFDSTPLIAITGQVGTGDLLSGRKVRQVGFQEVDTVAFMKPIAKMCFQPKSPDEMPSVMGDALFISTDGRPGPVVIDLPMDVQRGDLKGTAQSPAKAVPQVPASDSESIGRIAAMISAAERPVIFAGQGVFLSDAVAELRELAFSQNIPVVASLLSLGVVPTHSPLALGFIGHTGNQYAGLAVHNADLLIVIGSRLDVRQTGTRTDQFMKAGTIVRIDLDPDELKHSRIRADINVHADAKNALAMILKSLRGKSPLDRSPWLAQLQEWKKKYALDFDKKTPSIKPQHVIETVSRLTQGKDVVVTSGVGSHQQWCARHFDFDFPKRLWLTSGGHGAMGYDLPSAIGAQLAKPGALALCFAGDGSIQMNIQELQTLIDYKTNVKIFVLDNSRLALVSQFQLLNWKTDPTTGNKTNPDFAAIASAYGIKSFKLDKHSQVESIIQAALDHPGPALVHCVVDYHEDIVPMLLAGQTIDKMWPYE